MLFVLPAMYVAKSVSSNPETKSIFTGLASVARSARKDLKDPLLKMLAGVTYAITPRCLVDRIAKSVNKL